MKKYEDCSFCYGNGILFCEDHPKLIKCYPCDKKAKNLCNGRFIYPKCNGTGKVLWIDNIIK